MRFLCFVFLFAFLALSFGATTPAKDYGIMIDGGSSGSRIYLYEWPHREQNTLPLVEPTSINQTVISKKNANPLSGYTSNPGDAGASLSLLIDYVKTNLASDRWGETPIYLKATAGMRALNQSDQDAIIASVRKFLHTTPFEFQDNQAKVIPGTDEGVFGWITVNYALQLLQQNNPTTYGALDMGGASTQITFVPQSPPTSNLFNETLGPNNFPLYTYSYPLGQDQAGRLLLAGLLQDKAVDGSGNILSPCYLSGFNETYQDSVLAIGTGDYAACQAAIRKYIVTNATSCASTCGIGNVYQPAINGNYYAFSGFAYTNQFFKLAPNASISDLRNAGSAYCAESFQTVRSNYSDDTQYLKNYCFTATYLSEVLSKYGFADTSNQINTQTNIGNIELTWALGGMIYEANLLPFGDDSDSAGNMLASGFSGIFLFVLMVTTLLM
eukprot:Phypoly_transcript_08628.p1 GENE.Phypoly_transcript_08628~~Phypoly_transcript_08628.p1  ORF type:complete len:441 (+),score=65.14 Phypoly_transcript_08628:172-1494(+)